MIKDNTAVAGLVTVSLYGPDGELKDQVEHHNLVVATGSAFIASRMKDATATVMSHMALGNDATAPDAAQTALLGELPGRVALTSTTITTATTTDDSLTFVATFGPGVSTGAIVEAGIFNAGTGGTMLSRVTFPVVNKGALDTLGISWRVAMVGV